MVRLLWLQGLYTAEEEPTRTVSASEVEGLARPG